MSKKTKWQYKVVKQMRGDRGEWFDFPTAATFATEQEARDYAAAFASEQRAAGVTTARIDVRSRKSRVSHLGTRIHTVHTEIVKPSETFEEFEKMKTPPPVTTSGWYENTDGSLTEYTWRAGQLYARRSVASWSEVPGRDYAAEDRDYRQMTKGTVP